MNTFPRVLALGALGILVGGGPGGGQETASPQSTLEQNAVVIDVQAMSLLKKNQQTMFALKTYYAECRTILTREQPAEGRSASSYELSVLTAEKPNKMRYDGWRLETDPTGGWKIPTKAADLIFACDGKEHWRQYGPTYRKFDKIAPAYMRTILEPWEGFYKRMTRKPHLAQRGLPLVGGDEGKEAPEAHPKSFASMRASSAL